jgi:hypothetical protein
VLHQTPSDVVTYSGRIANSAASLWRTENFPWLHEHCICSCREWILGLCIVANASNYSLSFLISESHVSVFFPCSLYACSPFCTVHSLLLYL